MRRRRERVRAAHGDPAWRPSRARCRHRDSYDWFTTSGAERAPAWINECTLRSVEMFWEYEPGTYLPGSPPLLTRVTT